MIALIVQIASAVQAFIPTTGEARLVDCVDFNGVGVLQGQKFKAYDSAGKIVDEANASSDYSPLWYSKSEGLVQRRKTRTIAASNGTNMRHFMPEESYFAQYRSIFQLGGGATYLGFPTMSFPELNTFGAIGINESADRIAVVDSPMNVGYLNVFERSDHEWLKQSFVRSLQLKSIGTVALSQGLNDVRFVRKNIVAYFGNCVVAANIESKKQLDATIEDWTRFPLERIDDPQYKASVYLLFTRLEDGYTVAYAKAVEFDNGERNGPRTGVISVSKNYEFLFVGTTSGVLKVNLADALRRVRL